VIAVQELLAAVADEDPPDASSDAWRAIVGCRTRWPTCGNYGAATDS